MGLSYTIPRESGRDMGHRRATCDADQPQGWDEEIVADLLRWLSRFATVFAIMVIGAVAFFGSGWFWGRF